MAAPVLTLVLAAPALADPHREQIEIQSWSLPTPATQASPKLVFSLCTGQHVATPGTGRTMAAQVLASDLR